MKKNYVCVCIGFPDGTSGKKTCLPIQETQVLSLDQEDPLEQGMATHSSTLAWKILRTEKFGRQQSRGSHRAGHDCSDLACTHTCITESFCCIPETNTTL